MYYVLTEISEVFDLLNSYKISDESPYYIPKQVVLWIERRESGFVEATQNWPNNFQSWPSNLPPLSELITSVNFRDYKGVVVEENIDTLLQLFDYKMKLAFFKEDGEEYVVIARPLLPHETPDNFLWGSGQESTLTLPYKCGE